MPNHYVTPYSKEWFDDMRELERAGKLRRTVKEIAQAEMENYAQRAMRYVEMGKAFDAYCWSSIAASCALELLR